MLVGRCCTRHTFVKQTHTKLTHPASLAPPPHALTHPASSKLVVVNEAADICGAVEPLQLPGGHLTRPGQPHAGTTCAVACRGVGWEGVVVGWGWGNKGELCGGGGAVKTLVLSGTHSFTFLSGSAQSHSFQPSLIAIMRQNTAFGRRWDLQWDRAGLCGSLTGTRGVLFTQ